MCFFHVCHPLKGPLPFICLLRPKWATYQRDGDGLRFPYTFFLTSDAWSCLTSRILIERNSWNNSSRQSSLLPKLSTAICQLFAFHSSFGNDVPLGCKGLELLGGTSTGQNLVKNADAENSILPHVEHEFLSQQFYLQPFPTIPTNLLFNHLSCSEPNSIKNISVLTTIIQQRFHWWKLHRDPTQLTSPEAAFLKKVLNLDGLLASGQGRRWG